MKYFVFFVFMFLCSCGDDGCKTEEMRCDDNKVEVCNSEQDWDMFMDCDDLSIPDGGASECGYDTDVEVYSCIF